MIDDIDLTQSYQDMMYSSIVQQGSKEQISNIMDKENMKRQDSSDEEWEQGLTKITNGTDQKGGESRRNREGHQNQDSMHSSQSPSKKVRALMILLEGLNKEQLRELDHKIQNY